MTAKGNGTRITYRPGQGSIRYWFGEVAGRLDCRAGDRVVIVD